MGTTQYPFRYRLTQARPPVSSPALMEIGESGAEYRSWARTMRRRERLFDQGVPMPQFSSLSAVEAALSDGRLTRDYQVLLSERMVREENADRVLALLQQHGVAFTVSAYHYGDAIASRAERRPA